MPPAALTGCAAGIPAVSSSGPGGLPDAGPSPQARGGGPAATFGQTASASATSGLREPGITVANGKGVPNTWDSSDDSALFMLRRELWPLPVIARFTIEGEPVSKARARFTKQGSTTQAYTPEKTRTAEEVVGWQFRRVARAHKPDSTQAYGVVALFFCGTRQRRDADNMLKLILDGLNGVAWADDSQVTEVSAKKTLSIPENARTEVLVYHVGPLQRFTNHCEHCGREYPVFKSTTKDRSYCTTKCFDDARRLIEQVSVACQQCGTVFIGDQGRAFCSKECKYANGRTTVACSRCGVEFTKQKCHVRESNYCTIKCQQDASRERAKCRDAGTCETCGGPTTKKSYRRCRTCLLGGKRVTGRALVITEVPGGAS